MVDMVMQEAPPAVEEIASKVCLEVQRNDDALRQHQGHYTHQSSWWYIVVALL